MLQVDRTKKPSLKLPDDNRPKAPSAVSDSQPVENGRIIPDRSTKPLHDAKIVLTEEEKSRVHAETAALMEKNRQEKELRERQQEELKERLRREKEQEQKAREEQKEKEQREKLQQSKEDREQERDLRMKREQEEKEQERAHKEATEAKKQNKNEVESIGAKRIEIDKISMEEREKGTRTPEMQRRALGDASQTSVTVSGKVSEKVFAENSPISTLCGDRSHSSFFAQIFGKKCKIG